MSGDEVPEQAGRTVDGPTGMPAGPETGDGPPAPGSRLQARLTGAAYGALAAFGIALAIVGSFLYSWTLGPVPVAALAFVALTFGAVRLAGWAMGSKLGAVIPAVAWLVVVFALSTQRAEGDIVITGTLPGYLFLLGGSIAAVIAVALTPSPRSWLLRGADVDPSPR